MSPRHLLYPIFGILTLSGYTYGLARGVDIGTVSEERRLLPPGSPGGYRSPGFWYTGGYHGGK